MDSGIVKANRNLGRRQVQKMSKYRYAVYISPYDNYDQPSLHSPWQGGTVADIIGGLDNELLIVVAYERTKDASSIR